MNWPYIVIGCWLLIALVVWWMMDHAPDGYEDESGYHEGRKP